MSASPGGLTRLSLLTATILLTFQATRRDDGARAAEARVHALAREIDEAAIAQQVKLDNAFLTRVRETQVREMGEWVIALSREAAIQSIRAEEQLRIALDEASREIARAEDSIREIADRCAQSLTISPESRSSERFEASVREARSAFDKEIQGSQSRVLQMQQNREFALTNRSKRKRLAIRVALDVKNQFAAAISRLVTAVAEPEHRRLLVEEREGVLTRSTAMLERGRLAQERSLDSLGAALTTRTEALGQAERRMVSQWDALQPDRVKTPDEFSRRRQALLTEMSTALRDLAARNRNAIGGQTAALRDLWMQSDPTLAARSLDASQRAELLTARRQENELLQSTSKELDRLRAEVDAFRRRVALD